MTSIKSVQVGDRISIITQTGDLIFPFGVVVTGTTHAYYLCAEDGIHGTYLIPVNSNYVVFVFPRKEKKENVYDC